jgi:hypothetical protein
MAVITQKVYGNETHGVMTLQESKYEDNAKS